MLRWLQEYGDLVGSELADKALDDAALLLWKSGPMDDLITRAAKLYWPRPTSGILSTNK
jgi:hypothetical protein